MEGVYAKYITPVTYSSRADTVLVCLGALNLTLDCVCKGTKSVHVYEHIYGKGEMCTPLLTEERKKPIDK